MTRPAWAETSDLLRDYYDTEWGFPVRDTHGIYERVVLEGFHAVKHALRFGARVERVVGDDRAAAVALARRLAPDVAERLDGLLEEVSREELGRLAARRPHTGVVGFAARPEVRATDVVLDDGRRTRTVTLNRAYVWLYMPRLIWRDIVNFSSGAICLVLASLPFDENDYIRDYARFRATVGA